mgnify:CR=1 FL=1
MTLLNQLIFLNTGDDLNILLIGCGRIARKHAQAISENFKKIDNVYLCDIEYEKALEIKNILMCNGFNKEIIIACDYKDLLKKNKIDFSVIATESGKHYDIAVNCLNYGTHILVEKPLSMSTGEANKIINLADKKNLQVGVCFQNRYNASVYYLKRAVEEKRFGKINQVTARMLWNRNKDYYTHGKWRGTWELDGGALMNQSIHNIDLLQWICGSECKTIFADIKNYVHPCIEVEDYDTSILNFENGTTGLIEASTGIYPCNYEETLTVSGENGFVELGGQALNLIKCWKFKTVSSYDNMALGLEQNIDSVYGNGHILLYKSFIESLENNLPFSISGKEGKKALQIVLGCYKSSLEKSIVNMKDLNFSTLNMKGFFKS